MTTKAKFIGGNATYFDSVTGETTFSAAAVFFEDDFVGAGHTAGVPAAGSPTAGYPWVKKIVGAAPPTVAPVANGLSGQMAMTLTSTSEKQDAALYMNDNLSFDVTKGLIWEARLNLSALPSAAGVQFVAGMSSAWIDGPDNASFYLEFGATANGAINLRSKDGVNTFSVASGTTVVAGDWHTYKIDASDPTNVQFYIDGVQVSTTSPITFAATGSNAILQAYASMYKPSGTGVGTLVADFVQVRTNRV